LFFFAIDIDNEDVGRTRHGKESLDASVHIERVANTQARTHRCGSGRGRGPSKGPEGSTSQSQDDIEMPSSQVASGSQPPSIGVVQEGYDGGPSNTSLLPSFGQHIAAKIWNGEVRISFGSVKK